ncbi:MAG TPA: DinB family protein [Candidatus Limnocylindrales bacterium]|nr:DinB family protein [Candidatus Limnocylindrales bacterium]
MRLEDIRFLVAYDRWATRRVLRVLDGIAESTWSIPNAIGERGLGGILVHQLGATQRWRHGLSGSSERPRPERAPLPTPPALAAAFDLEWAAWDAWLATLDDEALLTPDQDIPIWQLLAHVVNHGTQHRSEAAALLTAEGRSPGDLDMVFFAADLAAARGATG